MQIEGKCHCGNIAYTLEWPAAVSDIAVRACGCSFCVKHGGNWTSHREASLSAKLAGEAPVTRYRFGTGTSDFYLCTRCGVVPFVTSAIDERLYAVVNANTFEGIDLASLKRSSTNFDGEGVGERLERRRRNWIADVSISAN
jgi:hypothetical protein